MPRRIQRLRRRRLRHVLPEAAQARRASTDEPHELDDGFVFWPESLGPRPSDGPALVRVGTASRIVRRPSRPRGRRLAASVAFSALFFGGAAFTASAGDRVAGLLGGSSASDPGAALKQVEPATASPVVALRAVHAPSTPRTAIAHVSVATTKPAALAATLRTVAAHRVASVKPTVIRVTPAKVPVVRHATRVAHKHVTALKISAPETTAPIEVAPSGTAFWESVALPDPIPAALRLAPSFAQQLTQTSTRAGVDWALVLGVARAKGGRSANPIAPADLGTLTTRLAALGAGLDQWAAARSYGGSAEFADRAIALAHYDRAGRAGGARPRARVAEARARDPRPQRLTPRDLQRRAGRHRTEPRRRPRPRRRRVPRGDVRTGHRLVPDLRPPRVRAARGRLGAHLRARGRHRGAPGHADVRARAAGQHHGAGSQVAAAPPATRSSRRRSSRCSASAARRSHSPTTSTTSTWASDAHGRATYGGGTRRVRAL